MLVPESKLDEMSESKLEEISESKQEQESKLEQPEPKLEQLLSKLLLMPVSIVEIPGSDVIPES